MTPIELSRRAFLKSVAAGTSALLGLNALGGPRGAEAKLPEAERVVSTQCNGCGNRCSMIVGVRRGRVLWVEGHPEDYMSRGRLCGRGHAFIHELDSSDRIRGPLKRVGPGRFEPISWEDAYREIAQKINILLLDAGPDSLFWLSHPQANALYAYRFMHAMGSPNIFSHGSTCYTARNAGWRVTIGALPENDMENARYIMLLGRNPAGGVKPYQLRELVEAKSRGATIVVVDPRQNESVVFAHRWVPIRPGTDLAFLLAIAHVLVREKLYDASFVSGHTVGFEQWAKELEQYTPEWAEGVCEVSARTIAQVAWEMGEAKPRAQIHRGYHAAFGALYLNSFQTARAAACVSALLGNICQEGGVYFPKRARWERLAEDRFPEPKPPAFPKADGTRVEGRYPIGVYTDGICHAIPELALGGVLKAGFVYHSNPVRTNPNPRRIIAGYKALELLVSFDYVLSETAMLAHYILPESLYLERDDVVDNTHGGKVAQIVVRQQAVPPRYDTKPATQIIAELAEHLGIGRYFKFGLEEFNRALIAPFGVELEELKERGVVSLGEPWKPGLPEKLRTPSGKVEIYSQTLADFGYTPIPVWEPPLVEPDAADPHAFRLIHGKQAIHSQSMTANQPYLMAITKEYGLDRVWMNSKRAAELGFREGDLVRIRSMVGEGLANLRLVEGLHPSAVWLPSGYGLFSRGMHTGFGAGISYNDFVPTMFDPVVGHAMTAEVVVRVTKA